MEIKTFFDFCSGIGGGRLGLERCGLRCVGSSDTSKLANITYDLLFPDKDDVNYGNLKKILNKDIPEFDLMIAGFPCQTFSVIGRQEGTQDTRGQIIYHLIDIIADKKPKVVLLENVKGLVTHDKGKTFKDILYKIEQAGYSVFYKVLNSLDYGVPHMRQRVYIVGFLNELSVKNFSWPLAEERTDISAYFSPADNFMSNEDMEWFKERYLLNEKNINRFSYAEIISMENIVVDTRMSDLRLYENRMPTLRAHRDGIYYVKNGNIYFLTGEEALAFQGFERDRISNVSGKVSNRHLLKQAGNAMTSNVVERLGKAIINTLQEVKKMKWKNFEEQSLEYLKEEYGDHFFLQGESDSTVSDILFSDKGVEFYIEAKMRNAQCGQFVLIPDNRISKFTYSRKNKTQENQYTFAIIEYMSRNFEQYENAGTSGVEINIDEKIFIDWIINYYSSKGVKFFVTEGQNDDFIIFPIEEFGSYFSVTAKYRVKKSGSSKLAASNVTDLELAMTKSGIQYRLDDLKIYSSDNLDGIKLQGEDYEYLLRKEEDGYRVRRLSKTRNANVIFSIALRNDILLSTIEEGRRKFEKYIGK